MRKHGYLFVLSLLMGGFVAGCGDDDDDGMNMPKMDMTMPNNPNPDLTMPGGGDCPPKYTENVAACMPAATDYQPRKMMPGSNGWMKCVSDDGSFHLVDMQLPPAAARVTAFESMATRLWKNASTPTS